MKIHEGREDPDCHRVARDCHRNIQQNSVLCCVILYDRSDHNSRIFCLAQDPIVATSIQWRCRIYHLVVRMISLHNNQMCYIGMNDLR